ncbi:MULTISPECIES: nuclear transport factor 2 family protein [Streptomyces]|uniref:nuclear transport factor 2 family protein n=1 Tax=Streptomyces TaxID=1883 RepID=UPI001C2FC5BC|nr:nuclear transport factor 2 family protein [Streptomyces sp. GbtcB7]
MNQTELHTAQIADETPAWVAELYSCFDTLNVEAVLAHFSDDCRIRFGNGEPTVGHEEFLAGAGAFLQSVRGMCHRFRQVWQSGDQTVLVADVEYVRHNGSMLSLPAVTLLHRRPDGLIDDMQVVLDVTPLFTV